MSEKFPSSNHESSDVPLNLERSAEEKPADRFRVNSEAYPIFTEQYNLDDRWGNNTKHYQNIDKTLSQYATQTANLIATLDGTSTEYVEDPELPIPDHVIYLDKSARPVSWLVNTFWSTLSDKKERPESSYLNIDRQPWFRRSGVELDLNGYSTNAEGDYHRNSFSDFRPKNIPPEDFARIRALYLPDGITDEDPATIMNTPSNLDGKNILIVDEVKRSGATLEIAKWLISHAFPDAKVRGAYFWESGSKTSPDGRETQMLSVPIWYDSSTSIGRGTGDIDHQFYNNRHEKFQTNRTRAQKYGSLVLSAIANLDTEPYQKSRELMHEISTMHQDYKAGRILMRFPRNYDVDRMENLLAAQNIRLAPSSDPSPDTYINILKSIDLRQPPI